MNEKLRRVLMVVLTLILLVSGTMVIRKSLDYRKGAQDYSDAEQIAGLKKLTEPGAEAPEEEEEEPIPYTDILAAIDLNALREVNSDVVGWIGIPDTDISYPILQCGDNSYYLNHTWKKEYSSVGGIFLDYRHSADLSGFHTLIYGHNMRNGSMFGGLKRYNNFEYWQTHPGIYIVDDLGIHFYHIFAAYEVGVQALVDSMSVEGTDQRQSFIQSCLNQSFIDTGIIPGPEDHLITLSTCTGRGHATRWIVQAVLEEIPET